MISDRNRKLLYFVIVLLIFLALLPIMLFNRPEMLTSINDESEHALCANYLKEGTIFQGQPYCASGGVMLYASIFIIRFLSGGAFNKIIYLALLILLNLHVLYCILRIVKHETDSYNVLLVTALYTALVFLVSYNFSSFFAMYYTVLGFTITQYYSFRYNRIIGPAIMTLGPLTKATALPIFGLLSAYIVYKSFNPRFENKKLQYSVNYKRTLTPIIAILAVVVLTYLIWPGSYAYEFGVQGSRVNLPYGDMIKQLIDQFNINSGTVFISLILLLSLIAWYFLRDAYSGITFIFIIALFTILFRQTGLGSDNGLQFAINRLDYYLPGYPFFIIAMAKLKQKLTSKTVKIAVGIVLALFLATAIEFPVSEHHVNSLEEHLKQAISFIPPQKNDIVLTEDPNSDKYLIDTYYDQNITLDIIPHHTQWKTGIFPDGNFLNQLIELRMTDSDTWMKVSDNQSYNLFLQKYRNKTYTIIFINSAQNSQLTRLVNTHPETREQYCMVNLPDLQFKTVTGGHELGIMFTNFHRCLMLLNLLNSYYSNSFESICKKSPEVANNLVKKTMLKHKIRIIKNCDRKPDSLRYINRKNYHVRLLSTGLALIIISICFVGFNMKRPN